MCAAATAWRSLTHAHDADDTTRTSPTTIPSAISMADGTEPASAPDAVAIFSTHILVRRSRFLPGHDADLCRLRAVSRGMRDAVDATLTDKEAAYLGCLSLLKDRHGRGVLNRGALCTSAARGGQLETLVWLCQIACRWNPWTCSVAAKYKYGHLDVLKWARANGCPWGVEMSQNAAKGGHLEVLRWAREKDCPWDSNTCAYAAEGGHLEVLRWACENGCPWNASTCEYAAKGGHLEVLRWARENGCPWDEHTRRIAVSKGFIEA